MTDADDAHGHDAHDHGGHVHLSHVPDASRPAVFAARAGLVFDPPAHPDQVEDDLVRFFAALSKELAGAGCTLVGHIKGTIAIDGARDGLAFHATALGTPPALTGGLSGAVRAATLTINVIVFGVDEQALAALGQDAWSGTTGAVTTWLH